MNDRMRDGIRGDGGHFEPPRASDGPLPGPAHAQIAHSTLSRDAAKAQRSSEQPHSAAICWRCDLGQALSPQAGERMGRGRVVAGVLHPWHPVNWTAPASARSRVCSPFSRLRGKGPGDRGPAEPQRSSEEPHSAAGAAGSSRKRSSLLALRAFFAGILRRSLPSSPSLRSRVNSAKRSGQALSPRTGARAGTRWGRAEGYAGRLACVLMTHAHGFRIRASNKTAETPFAALEGRRRPRRPQREFHSSEQQF
jgi:hypothetical protein